MCVRQMKIKLQDLFLRLFKLIILVLIYKIYKIRIKKYKVHFKNLAFNQQKLKRNLLMMKNKKRMQLKVAIIKNYYDKLTLFS